MNKTVHLKSYWTQSSSKMFNSSQKQCKRPWCHFVFQNRARAELKYLTGFFCGPSPQGWTPPLCWKLYPYLQNVPEEECCVLRVDLSASRNPAWSPLIIMNCPIVHVVQVIREGKKSVRISIESIIPSKIILIPVVLLFTILAWRHHSPVGPPGCRSSWQHPPHHLQLCYKGSCLISHLEEKWPRVIDCNCAVTDFISTQWGKMQLQEGFLGSSGFWASQKFRQVSHSSQRILPVWPCGWSLTRDCHLQWPR